MAPAAVGPPKGRGGRGPRRPTPTGRREPPEAGDKRATDGRDAGPRQWGDGRKQDESNNERGGAGRRLRRGDAGPDAHT